MQKQGVRARRKAARPGEIVEAAFLAFVEKGYDQTKLEDIADRLNVTKGTIYFYFANKEALFRDVILHRYARCIVDLEDLRSACVGDPVEQLKTFIRLGFRHLGADLDARHLLGLLIKEGPRFPDLVEHAFREIVDPRWAMCAAILAAGEASGVFRPGLSTATPDVVMAPVLMLAVTSLLQQTPSEAEIAALEAATIDLILKAVANPAA